MEKQHSTVYSATHCAVHLVLVIHHQRAAVTAMLSFIEWIITVVTQTTSLQMFIVSKKTLIYDEF